jgi:hypothetical protein
VNHPLDALFDQFLKERRYLKNVTEGTLVWYRVAFSHYTSFVADDHAPLPTKARDRVKLPKLRVEAGSTRSAAALDTNGWPEREGQHQSPRSRG